MGNLFAALCRNPVTIDVAPNRFQFRWKERSLSLATVVWLSEDHRVLAVGEWCSGSEKSLRIELFSETLPEQGILRSEVLEVILRYGLQKVVNRRIFLRPQLVFRQTEGLAACLDGCQNEILEEAGLKAGASVVVIES